MIKIKLNLSGFLNNPVLQYFQKFQKVDLILLNTRNGKQIVKKDNNPSLGRESVCERNPYQQPAD